MRFYISILLVIFLLSCNDNQKQNNDVNPETMDTLTTLPAQNNDKESPHDTKFLKELPNPGYLLYKDVVKDIYPQYDEEKDRPEFTAKANVLAIIRFLDPSDEKKQKYVRLDTRIDPMPDSRLKDRVGNYEGYVFVEGMPFDAAWNQKLMNLTFRVHGHALNVMVKDKDITNDQRLAKAERLSIIIADRLAEILQEKNQL